MSEITDEYTVDLSWIPKGFYDVLMTSYQIMELPTEIKIVAPPSKLIYTNGEDIDVTGMLVVAFKKDGTIWSEDPNYPNGIIPLSEITIEPTTATAEGTDEYSDGDGVNAILCTIEEKTSSTWGQVLVANHILGSYNGSSTSWIGSPTTVLPRGGTVGGTFLITEYNGSIFCKLVTGSEFNVDLAGFIDEKWRSVGSSNHHIYNDSQFHGGASFTSSLGLVPKSTKDPTQAGELHPVGGNQEITVKWNRTEDEQELSDTFNITVNN